jgi:hypothetical protein
MQICQVFPALDPIRLRREKCGEVMLLLQRIVRHKTRDEENKNGGSAVDSDTIIVRKKNGDTITMRRAKDDRSW